VATKRAKPAGRGAARGGRLHAAAVRLRLWLRCGVLGLVGLAVALVVLFALVNPPLTHTMWVERQRLGVLARDWVPLERVAPAMARAVVAAEDANFCRHWGFDVDAIRAALEAGARRGASTISQQTVKNVYLWQGRSWGRKALEAALTPLVELVWSKRRILEVYLNVAEFDAGVFGVEAAAQRYFGVSAAELSPAQAARLAVVLPDPRGRDAGDPTPWLRQRAASVADGAETIRRDGRADCFGAG